MNLFGTAGAAGVALLLAIAAGCLNFVEPEPGPGRLRASLRLMDDTPAAATFLARFSPGVDVDGEFRSVAEPSIRILEAAVPPSADGEPPELEYRDAFQVEAAELEPSTVEMIGPRLHERQSAVVVEAPLIWRAGSSSLRLDDGEDLELSLRGVPEQMGEDLVRLRWSLEIRASGRSTRLFSAEGTGALPDTLRVQHEALEGSPGDEPLEAVLDVVTDVRAPAGTVGYDALLSVTVHLKWEILAP